MLVYGDPSRRVSARAAIESIGEALRRVAAMPPGLERHSELVAAFIDLAALTQGIADAEFEARGCDARSPVQDSAMAALTGVAQAIRLSWDSGFADVGPAPPNLLEGLSAHLLPECLDVKQPEGYAFYALYPEGYLQASSALAGVSPVRV
ncbi:MAG: hypothetical protein M3158_04605, partial [Pseudomonadota bacterium]|nr:hypothetical protein [Pseudomonadota bacterium]